MRTLISNLAMCAIAAGLLGQATAASLLVDAAALHAQGKAAFEKASVANDSAAQADAIASLRRALELYNEHLDEFPDDISKCEEQLTDINATLFWHGRMSVPDFGDDDDDEEAGGADDGAGEDGAGEDGAGKDSGNSGDAATRVDPEAQQREFDVRKERLASERLSFAHDYMTEFPADLYGQRVEYREVVIQFPGTDAATAAKLEVARLEAEIRALEAKVAEIAGDQALHRANEAARVKDEKVAEAARRVPTLLEDLEARLDEMKGTDSEREIRERIRHLFAKRRFVEAYIECQRAMEHATDNADRARLDRILAGLSRAVTILDQVVAHTMSQVGKKVSMEVTGGAVFEGKLKRITWDAMVIQTKDAKLHLPYFRLSDDALVRTAALHPFPEAGLASGAYLAMIGRGKDAMTHLRRAEKRGADADEVELLRILAGDEKVKSELAASIRKETKRWRSVDRMAGKFIKSFKKQDYLEALKALLKVDKKPGLEDRDLKVLSQRFDEELGRTLAAALLEARETCAEPHIDEENRQVSCPKCNGQGTILTRSPGGLFGPKTRGAVRVRCPGCRGIKTRGCPNCFDRFHDKAARALQARLGP